jgi:hypothetical protein
LTKPTPKPKQHATEVKLRRLAQAKAKDLKKVAKSQFLLARDRVSLDDLKAALATGTSGPVEAAAKIDELEVGLGELLTGLLAALLAGGKSAEEEHPGVALNHLNAAVLNAVQTHGALAVKRVSNGTRAAIRSAVSRALSEDMDIEAAAKEIRNVIGLTAPQERSLAIQRATMEKAGVVKPTIERTLAERTKRMLDHRAAVIAENEAFMAISAGRQLFWQGLVDSGELSPRTQRKWITAADEFVCEVCRPMHGQVRGLTEFFTTGEGSLILTSPAHPVCRCSVILVE